MPRDPPVTIADGLRTCLGELTFTMIRAGVESIVTVEETAIVEAMPAYRFVRRVRRFVDPVDVVVANILAGPLVDLSATITAFGKAGCLLALSGILGEQVEDVQAAYRHRIAFDEPVYREQGGQTWALLTGRRNEN